MWYLKFWFKYAVLLVLAWYIIVCKSYMLSHFENHFSLEIIQLACFHNNNQSSKIKEAM